MPKRKTGTKMRKISHSHKTKKRLEAKRLMLKARANERRLRRNRHWLGLITHTY